MVCRNGWQSKLCFTKYLIVSQSCLNFVYMPIYNFVYMLLGLLKNLDLLYNEFLPKFPEHFDVKKSPWLFSKMNILNSFNKAVLGTVLIFNIHFQYSIQFQYSRFYITGKTVRHSEFCFT